MKWPFNKDKFGIIAECCAVDGTCLWRVLINDKKSFYSNFKTVPPGIPYRIEDWEENKIEEATIKRMNVLGWDNEPKRKDSNSNQLLIHP